MVGRILYRGALSSKRNCLSRIKERQQLEYLQYFTCITSKTTEDYKHGSNERRGVIKKEGYNHNALKSSPSVLSPIRSTNLFVIEQQRHGYRKLAGLRCFTSSNVGSEGGKNTYEEDSDVKKKTKVTADIGPTTTEEYLSSLGYTDEKLQDGIKDALKAAFGKNITISHLKSLGADGLSALSKSVTNELNCQNDDTSVYTVCVKVPHHKFEFYLKVREGDNFMTAATQTTEGREILGEYLECSCGGNMSCATCHIILDPESFDKLGEPCEAECDMLDLAYEPTDTSRLGCQVVMSKELDNMTVTIPSGVNNLWS